MPKTYTSVYVHYVFSTKNRMPVLSKEIRERLWAYMGGIARENGMVAKAVGGFEDHAHLLVSLPTTITMAKGVQLIKGGSSKWLHETFPALHDFAWQEGYGAFGACISIIPETIAYIADQEEHHRHKSFQVEYIAFLKKHEIAFDERYLWD
jgi:putative transposase